MHHYPFHIGDYRSGCINLTQLERWVYRDLLDVCYDTESPLPSDHTILFRLVGARTPEHQEAVLNVIGDKFVKTENGYENVRVQSEIAKYHKKADAARNANQRRWASDADLKSDANKILTKNQEPRTNNQNQKPNTRAKRDAPAGALSVDDLVAEGVDLQHAQDWMRVRKDKGAKTLTKTAWESVKTEAQKAGMTPAEAVKTSSENSWQGFKAAWVDPNPPNNTRRQTSRHTGFDDKDYMAGVNSDGSIQ